MTTPLIKTWQSGGSGYISLNRPEKLNALCNEMVRAMRVALRAFRDDPSVNRVILMAEGERAFCAGGDLSELYALARTDRCQALRVWDEEYQMTVEIAEFPKTTLAVVHGLTMGAGLGIALACDYIFMASDALCATPELKAGFYPDVGLTWHLGRLPGDVGWRMAVDGLSLTARDCFYYGLCSGLFESQSRRTLLRDLELCEVTKASFSRESMSALLPSDPSSKTTIPRRALRPAVLQDLPAVLSSGTNSSAAFQLAVLLMQDARDHEDMTSVIRRDMQINRLILEGSDFYLGVAAVLSRASVERWVDQPGVLLPKLRKLL